MDARQGVSDDSNYRLAAPTTHHWKGPNCSKQLLECSFKLQDIDVAASEEAELGAVRLSCNERPEGRRGRHWWPCHHRDPARASAAVMSGSYPLPEVVNQVGGGVPRPLVPVGDQGLGVALQDARLGPKLEAPTHLSSARPLAGMLLASSGLSPPPAAGFKEPA